MKKDHRTGVVTWYSYDGNGTLGAIFEQQGTGVIQLKEQPIYGSDRLGIYYRQGSNYQYTLSDNLGNTRVVINRNKTASGSADVIYYADYLPFGTEVRSGGIDHRYGYQGLYAERDKETGLNSFELRNYDPILARWLTPDPYGQYDSPYVGMGNNPINRTDKDGGWSKDNIGINRKGEVVFDDGKKDGNLFLVNDDVGKIKDLEMLKGNSIQLAKFNVWIGTDQQKIDYVKSQWKFAEGGFDWFSSTNRIVTNTKKQSAFSVDAFIGDNAMTGANDMFNVIFTIQDQGLTNTLLSDPYNTRNGISHEKRHLIQSVKVHHGSLVNPTTVNLELDAIRYQRSVKSWQNTTELFKRGVKGYENKFTF